MTATAFYNELAATAQSLIDEFGEFAVLIASGNSTYDPATGSTAEAAGASVTVTAVVFDYDEKVIDGTLIQRGDKQVYLGAVGLAEPKTTTQFIFPTAAGEIHTVIAVKPLGPAGINLLYELQVRK